MSLETITTKARDIQPEDELKTEAGWLKTGGIQDLGNGRVGIYTPSGLIGVPGDASVTVRRVSKEG
ncbi:hypothetical protein SEA_SHROOMS_94 [Arthrobacter phage Shrooms]|nr:hypothetical protein SEA_SHROOMS_94 [Arthrobacter phage Shrooms]